MSKIKEIFKNTWSYLILVGGAIIGLLLYFIDLKNKQLTALKAKIDLLDTQKKADALEVEIKQKLAKKDLIKSEQETLKKALDYLAEKRQNIEKEGNLTDSQIENYWNNKK